MMEDRVRAFLELATVPLDAHQAGSLDEANARLAADPSLADAHIGCAAVLGNVEAIRRFVATDATLATAPTSVHGWDALTTLCFSRYLRDDATRSAGFVAAATALLDAGANPNGGFWDTGHAPTPMWESVLYGAVGIAHHADLTAVLLARGANGNDVEVSYHAPESYDNAAMQVLVTKGALSAEHLAVMLLRKADWHDVEGVRWLLAQGADPNRHTQWEERTALHQAILRGNSLSIITAMVDHGADPLRLAKGVSALALAARTGRRDVLALFDARGIATKLLGADAVLSACARHDTEALTAVGQGSPDDVQQVLANGGTALALFARTGNNQGIALLLDLGVPVDAVWVAGDAYFGIAPYSQALHVAAWRAQHDTVHLLIARHAPMDVRDGWGRSALALAVRACVDSYWMNTRSPDSVDALLRAGASTVGVAIPCGYAEVDLLFAARGMLAPPPLPPPSAT